VQPAPHTVSPKFEYLHRQVCWMWREVLGLAAGLCGHLTTCMPRLPHHHPGFACVSGLQQLSAQLPRWSHWRVRLSHWSRPSL
jgi:hypothetical protein